MDNTFSTRLSTEKCFCWYISIFFFSFFSSRSSRGCELVEKQIFPCIFGGSSVFFSVESTVKCRGMFHGMVLFDSIRPHNGGILWKSRGENRGKVDGCRLVPKNRRCELLVEKKSSNIAAFDTFSPVSPLLSFGKKKVSKENLNSPNKASIVERQKNKESRYGDQVFSFGKKKVSKENHFSPDQASIVERQKNKESRYGD